MGEDGIIIETDLQLTANDIVIGDCKDQNIKHLLIADPGNFLISPKIGGGLYRFQNSQLTDVRDFTKRIKETLKADGYESIVIDGKYTEETQKTEIVIDGKRIKKPKRQII